MVDRNFASNLINKSKTYYSFYKKKYKKNINLILVLMTYFLELARIYKDNEIVSL